MATKYQNISQFLASPFGKSATNKTSKYEGLYSNYLSSNKIRVEGYCKIEEAYYVHIKVPSESQKNGKLEYDVVIRFFTDDRAIRFEASLKHYNMQFFSNSPGFMYQYAVLYKQYGYLIEFLYNKLDPNFFDKLPEKANPNMDLCYDKSLYFACKFLTENKFLYMTKLGIIMQRSKKPDRFFRDISDFQTVKMDQEMISIEKRMNSQIKPKELKPDPHRKLASGNTAKEVHSIIKKPKIGPAKNRVQKKTATKSTTRKK